MKLIKWFKIISILGLLFAKGLRWISSKLKDTYKKLKIIEVPSVWIERKDRKSSFKIFKWSRAYLKWFFIAFFI